MSERAVLGFPRWTELLTLAGGSWEAAYPLTNLKTLPLSRVARSTAATTAATQLTAALSPARPVRLVGLCRHNLSLAARYRLRLESLTAVENLVQYSQQLDNAWWSKSNASVVANAGVAPDGTTTADKLVENTATAQHLLTRSSVTGLTAGLPYTLSFWAKDAGRTNVYVRADDGAGGNEGTVVLATGAGTMYGTPPSGCTIAGTLAADGWCRVDFTFPALTGTTISNLYLGTGAGSYAGDGAAGNLIWGVHLVQGLTGGSYVATTNATRSSKLFDLGAPYDSLWRDVWPRAYPLGAVPYEDVHFWGQTFVADDVAGYPWNLILWLDQVHYTGGLALELDDTANAAGYVQAGLLEVAQGWQVGVNYAFGAGLGWELRSEPERAEGGVEWTERRAKPRRFDGEIPLLPEAEALAQGSEALRQLDRDKPWLWVPRPAAPEQFVREAFLARWAEPGLLRFASPGRRSLPLSLVEVLG